ncbi:hypothetical protein D3C86_1764450 [compost metagenome]
MNFHPYFTWTDGGEFESLELKYFWAADLGKCYLLHTILPRALAIQSVPGCRAQALVIDGDVSDDECALAPPNLLGEQVNSDHYKGGGEKVKIIVIDTNSRRYHFEVGKLHRLGRAEASFEHSS